MVTNLLNINNIYETLYSHILSTQKADKAKIIYKSSYYVIIKSQKAQELPYMSPTCSLFVAVNIN